MSFLCVNGYVCPSQTRASTKRRHFFPNNCLCFIYFLFLNNIYALFAQLTTGLLQPSRGFLRFLGDSAWLKVASRGLPHRLRLPLGQENILQLPLGGHSCPVQNEAPGKHHHSGQHLRYREHCAASAAAAAPGPRSPPEPRCPLPSPRSTPSPAHPWREIRLPSLPSPGPLPDRGTHQPTERARIPLPRHNHRRPCPQPRPAEALMKYCHQDVIMWYGSDVSKQRPRRCRRRAGGLALPGWL